MSRWLLLCLVPLLCAEEKVDLYTVNRIKQEAFESSAVMDTAFYLTDVYGPRLTNSPGFQRAAEWAARRLGEWGLSGARLEKWGPFGRGWSPVRFSAHLKEPRYAPLIGFARPWSPGVDGKLTGEPVMAVMRIEADMEKFKGKLRGKIVLVEEPRKLLPQTQAAMRRLSDADLQAVSAAPEPAPPGRPVNRDAARRFRHKLNQFLTSEGVVLSLTQSSRADGGTVFATAAGSHDPKDPAAPPSVALTGEHYARIARMIDKKVPVTLEFEIENRFHEETSDSVNVIAELPGTSKKDEVVMIGAHLDSWTGGTGATDNAAGCAVALEALRILKALDLKPARTIRIALWSGEEQGLLGSKAYVKQHFGDPETMVLKTAHKQLSGYFNLDNGTGKIRGVYLQNNDMMRPVFEAWLQPFKDLGVTTISIRNTGSTDHVPFDNVGLPGFQFIQDPVEYSTRTHHSNMDVYDRLQAGDLMQASAVMASVVYHAAMRGEMLPRKPLPKPQPKKKEEAKEPARAPSL